jgi:hypothetical protein
MTEILIKHFQYYQKLAEETFKQISDEQFFWKYNDECDSIATLVHHISGNINAHFVNFTAEEDKIKSNDRNSEFENDLQSKSEIMEIWDKSWEILFKTLNRINDENRSDTIIFHGEEHIVLDLLLQQLTDYTYHIGQIVFIGKMLKNSDWKTLSVEKNQSSLFNMEKFKSPGSADIPENSSPVCFAKSDEIRDDYKI